MKAEGARMKAACLAAATLTAMLTAAPQLPVAPRPVDSSSRARVFAFGPGPASAGVVRIEADTLYSTTRGYGVTDASNLACAAQAGGTTARIGHCSSATPFRFVVDVPEGNYRVRVTLGGDAASETTVRAESRRLMAEHVRTAAGATVTREFTVNVRTSSLAAGGAVALKSREIGAAHWDRRLTLEFGGERPSVTSIEVQPNPDATTVFLAGDSTVTDQTEEPWCAWGQMLPRFLAPDVAVANHAESGESLRSFVAERRFEKVFEQIKAGDYLFIQFAHNDQKLGSDTSSYETALRTVIADARNRGAIPVLVTSMERRRFDAAGKIVPSLEGFPDAMRRVARSEATALIDLTTMSRQFYEALGPDRTKLAFVHYPARTFPGQDEELKDDTHFNAYGGYQLARAIVEGIRRAGLGLGARLASDVATFDPAHPDAPETFALPRTLSARRAVVGDSTARVFERWPIV